MKAAHLSSRLLCAATVGLALVARSQTPDHTGTVTGRVFNPSTGEYIRNTEVRIQGTPLVAVSEEGGHYRLINAPIGGVTLVASYIGHESVSAKVCPH